jgi:PadR family transcriptional regulator PadR
MKTIDRELKRGTLELVLLKLLSGGQMYGYELVSTLEREGGELFQVKEGTLYPVLYRLEDAGWVETRWQTLERGVPRKYYRLTAAGEEQLARLVQDWRQFSATVDRLLGSEP